MISLLCVKERPEDFDSLCKDLEYKYEFSITASFSADEALMLLKKQSFDVIISMYDLPDMKGIDLLQTARTKGCGAPFIFYDGLREINEVPDAQARKKEETKPIPGPIKTLENTNLPEQRSNQIEALIRAIADRSSIAILLHCNGNRVYANRAAEEITGYKRDELQKIDPITLVQPAEREKIRTWAQQRLEGDRPAERDSLTIIQKDGKERPVEITTEYCTIADSLALIISARDLKTAETNPCSLCSSFFELYFRTGTDGIVEMVSHSCEEILGWKPDEVKGRRTMEFLPDPDEKKEMDRLLGISGHLQDYDVHLLRKDGTIAEFSLNARNISGADGTTEGLEGLLRKMAPWKDQDEDFSRSKALITALLETTKDGILVTDTDGRPITCNRTFRTMWRIPLTTPLTSEDLQKVITTQLKGKDERHSPITINAYRQDKILEGVFECTDNRIIGYLSKPQKIGDEIIGRVWNFSDITRKKEIENALLEREHFFITLLNAIRDGVLILSKNGMVRYANSAAGELLGLPSAGDCVGRNILEFVHQDSIHAFFRDLLSIRGGSDAIPAEYTFIALSGEVRQVEGLSSSIIWNDEKAIAITLRDITERKQAEAAAQESADLNRTLIDGLPEYIFVLTGEGNIIFTNPVAEAALRCTPGAMTGKTMRSFIVERSVQDFDVAVQEAFAGQKPRSFEIGIKTVTDDILQVTLRAASITFRNQKAVLVLLTDLTERLILEKELEYHARELKRFSESLTRINEKLTIMNSITRHDILNQLTVLLGYLEIAAEENTEPEVRESLTKMKSAAQNIREQLEFTRDYQDIGVREPQWCDVGWHIVKLGQDGITINTKIRDIEVYADPLFGRVFYNLLDNAVRHGHQVTEIRVTSRIEEDGALTIVWEDNGIGVKEGEKEEIFRRGYGSNTGLGLFLCREILAITGMKIRECGEYGKGARFEIRVPSGGYRRHADRKSTPSDRA